MASMRYKEVTLEELSQKASTVHQKHALIGMDGFIDKILHVVDQRTGKGDQFQAMREIPQFGERVMAAAGKSANIELFPVLEKLGGNGPIMANALCSQGLKTQYIGPLGLPIHNVFSEFAERTNAVSLGEPGVTHALEFEDGKLMLGLMNDIDRIDYRMLIDQMGEGAFIDAINQADLVGLVNWTMISNMTEIMEGILSQVLPNLGPKEEGRCFFFDLTDPAKRSKSDLKHVLQVIRRYQNHGRTLLGLNLSEARQVTDVLGLGEIENNADGLKAGATRIRDSLEISLVVIHPREGAACATKEDSYYTDGPFCEKPKISTGAGDHFNAGFASAMSIGLSPGAALTVAVATSGYYVRTAKSPSLQEIATFIESWT